VIFLFGFNALSTLHCIDAVGWVTGRHLKNLPLISSGTWGKKTHRSRLTQVHPETGFVQIMEKFGKSRNFPGLEKSGR